MEKRILDDMDKRIMDKYHWDGIESEWDDDRDQDKEIKRNVQLKAEYMKKGIMVSTAGTIIRLLTDERADEDEEDMNDHLEYLLGVEDLWEFLRKTIIACKDDLFIEFWILNQRQALEWIDNQV